MCMALDIESLQRLEVEAEAEERVLVGTVQWSVAEALVVIGVEEWVVSVPKVVVQVRRKAWRTRSVCDVWNG